MNLGLKFALLLVIPLVALTVTFGYANQRRNQALLRAELEKEGRAIALVVETAAEDYLRDLQLADLRQLADKVAGYERVLGMRIFGPDGHLVYQSSSLNDYPFQNFELLNRVIAEKRTVELRRKIGRENVLGFLFPLSGKDGHFEGVGQVLQLESYMEADARANRSFILALTLVMALATITIILFVVRFSVTRPIAALVAGFRMVTGGDELPARVPVRGNDELARLALEFNGMCGRLEAAHRSLEAEQRKRQQIQDRLRNAQRLAGLGRLAAGLAHEIGTPLNVISGRADSLIRHLGHDERSVQGLRSIAAQSERIVGIVRDMLDFARMKPPRRSPVSVAEVIQEVLDLAGEDLRRNGISTRVVLPLELPPVIADRDQLIQVFMNLLTNARDAMHGGGALEVRGEWQTRTHPERGGPARPHVAITFADSGAGIPESEREHVFDPFFTTKGPGKGMGLGLAVSYGIVEEHGGWFDLESEPGMGTRITVHLPVVLDPEMAGEGEVA